jgi:hypothetical protein
MKPRSKPCLLARPATLPSPLGRQSRRACVGDGGGRSGRKQTPAGLGHLRRGQQVGMADGQVNGAIPSVFQPARDPSAARPVRM